MKFIINWSLRRIFNYGYILRYVPEHILNNKKKSCCIQLELFEPETTQGKWKSHKKERKKELRHYFSSFIFSFLLVFIRNFILYSRATMQYWLLYCGKSEFPSFVCLSFDMTIIGKRREKKKHNNNNRKINKRNKTPRNAFSMPRPRSNDIIRHETWFAILQLIRAPNITFIALFTQIIHSFLSSLNKFMVWWQMINPNSPPLVQRKHFQGNISSRYTVYHTSNDF